MKRKILVAAVVVLLAGLAGTALVLRTPWAARKACAIAESRIRTAAGVELALASCRFDPFHLEVTIGGIRIGPAAAPLFTADSLRARLSALQIGGRQLDLASVELIRPRAVVQLPSPARDRPASVCPPPLLQRFGIHRLTIRDGALDLTLPNGERLTVDRFDIHSTSPQQGRIADLARAVTRRARIGLTVTAVSLQSGAERFAVDDAYVDAEVALDLSRADVTLATAQIAGVTVAASGRIDQLCRPRFDLAASIEGEVRSVLALLGKAPGRVTGRIAVDAAITGPLTAPKAAGEVRLTEVSIAGWRPGDAKARLRLDADTLRVDALEVPMLGGRIDATAALQLGREVRLEAEARLHHVELAEIFDRLQLTGAWVMARVDGTARVSGTVHPLRLEGEAGLDISSFRVLDHAWTSYRPGEATMLDAARVRLDAGVQIDPVGVRIDAGRVRAGQGALSARAMLHFADKDGFEVSCDGTVDLGVLRHVGPIPFDGLARLEGGVVRAAPYGNPRIEGRVSVSGTRFLKLDLGDVAARLTYDRFVLDVTGIEGRRGATRFEGSLAVALGRTPVEITNGRFRAEGRLRDLFEAAMPWQPNAVHARDALDGAVTVRATLDGPASALGSRFEAELGPGSLFERPFDGGRITGRIDEGERAVFDDFELRRSGGVARVGGTVGFEAPFPWTLDGTLSALRVSDLQIPGTTWGGVLAGKVSVRGSFDDPRLEATATARRLEIARLVVGDTDLRLRLTGRAWQAEARAEGLSVIATGQAVSDVPFEGKAEIDAADVFRIAPGAPPAGLSARVRGQASFAGRLTEVASTSLDLRLDEVRGGLAEFQVENAAPVVATMKDGRILLRSFSMRGANTHFDVTGARERSGQLALDARGALDLRLFGGVVPTVADPRGQVLVEARVGGTVTDPVLLGTGKLREASFRVRDAPITFAGISGELSFSQNRMLFDQLSASINGGRAALDGEVELVRFFPARIRVGVQLDEVPMRIPSFLPSVVSGRIQAAGTWDAMRASGKIHLVRAVYTEPVDLEKRLVEPQRRRREPKPFDPAAEAVALDIAVAADGDVRIENDVARGALKGDLTLTGTLGSPGVIGTLTMTPGGRALFRGNEFVLSHAVVDFTDRRKLQMRLDATGDAIVRDYQVFMHVVGPYEDPTVSLSTQPALSQQDIVTLLSLGYTTRDTAGAGAVTGVATAAAAQALFTASGLDDQVRRFVPRGRVLRDFNVRITSAYSEGVGQVVPRAEFESKVLDDRFRLRYQAPLAGARGQRAQAEMRLGEHTSVQYQWDTDNPDVTTLGGDHGVDLKLRWDWTE